MPPAQVRTPAETLLLPKDELEEELRRGRYANTVLVQHEDWTGEHFSPAKDVPALREALGSPEARMCAQLRKRGLARGTAVGMLVVLGLGALQWALSFIVPDVAESLAVGFERTVLDRAFWTPFSAAFTHVNLGHFIVNAPILAYCGYRVERVLGMAGLCAVMLCSLAVSSTTILAFSDLPVVGASTLAYGAWGAQIMLGFRFGNLIPDELQSRYGVGNLALFLPLAFMGLFSGPMVSHSGHAGGLIGGVIAVLLCDPFSAARSRAVAIGAAALALALPWTPPALWSGSAQEVTVSRAATLTLPSRWATKPGRFSGMHAWFSGDAYPVFAGTFVVDEGGEAAIERERQVWSEWLHTPAEVTELGPDHFEIRADNGEETFVIVERVADHGDLRTRAGYLLPADCGPCQVRRAVGNALIGTLVTE